MGITFGRRIRERRETLGLSAYRVGKDAGIKAPNYSTLESGKTPPSDSMIAKLAPVLGVEAATLRAWALEDELGQEEAQEVGRHLSGNPSPEEGVVRELDEDPRVAFWMLRKPAGKGWDFLFQRNPEGAEALVVFPRWADVVAFGRVEGFKAFGVLRGQSQIVIRDMVTQGVHHVAVYGASGDVSFYPDPVAALLELDPASGEA